MAHNICTRHINLSNEIRNKSRGQFHASTFRHQKHYFSGLSIHPYIHSCMCPIIHPSISHCPDDCLTWWHNQMEIFSTLLAFVWGIHQWPVNSPHKGQWHGALMFSLICVWTNSWANNGDTGDLRRHGAHYDVTVMINQIAIQPAICTCSCMSFHLSIHPQQHWLENAGKEWPQIWHADVS